MALSKSEILYLIGAPSDSSTPQRSSSDELNKRVIIVDGLNMFFRNWMSNPMVNTQGEHVGGMIGFLRSLGANARNFKATRVICVFDGKNSADKRRKINKKYKGNRNVEHNLNRGDLYSTIEEEIQNMKYQIVRLIEYLELFPVDFISVINQEADDIIAYMVSDWLVEDKTCEEVIVVSSDKDFLQLCHFDKVKVYRPTEKKMYDKDVVTEKFDGLHYSNITIGRAIEGDSSDGILGIKGLGIKSIIKHVPELTERFIPIDDFIERIKKCDNKRLKNLIENISTFENNYQIMDLNKHSLSGTAENKVLTFINNNSEKKFLNRIKLIKLLTEDSCEDIFRNLDHWIFTVWKPLERK